MVLEGMRGMHGSLFSQEKFNAKQKFAEIFLKISNDISEYFFSGFNNMF